MPAAGTPFTPLTPLTSILQRQSTASVTGLHQALALSPFDKAINGSDSEDDDNDIGVLVCASYCEKDVWNCCGCGKLRLAFHCGIHASLFLEKFQSVRDFPAIKKEAADKLQLYYPRTAKFGAFNEFVFRIYVFDEELSKDTVVPRILETPPIDELIDYEAIDDGKAKTIAVMHVADGFVSASPGVCGCICRRIFPQMLCSHTATVFQRELKVRAVLLYCILFFGAIVALLLLLFYDRISGAVVAVLSVLDMTVVSAALLTMCRDNAKIIITTKAKVKTMLEDTGTFSRSKSGDSCESKTDDTETDDTETENSKDSEASTHSLKNSVPSIRGPVSVQLDDSSNDLSDTLSR